MKLSYKSYKAACDTAYKINCSSPTIFWNCDIGFYVGSGSIHNEDLRLGVCHYALNNGGNRSHSGSRSDYYPIGRAIRDIYKIGEKNNEKILNRIREIGYSNEN